MEFDLVELVSRELFEKVSLSSTRSCSLDDSSGCRLQRYLFLKLSQTSQELTGLFIDTQEAGCSNEMHTMTKQGKALYTNKSYSPFLLSSWQGFSP